MDAKERLYSAATQDFDKCLQKYALKIKNCLYGMICHAYNEGRKDGIQIGRLSAQVDDKHIQIGDEVSCVDATGKFTGSRFIVTEYDKEEMYIGGITLDGSTHFHSENEVDDWYRTGRHFDIQKMLDIFNEQDKVESE